MKRYILLAGAAVLGFLFSGCESHSQQVKDAAKDLRQAQDNLREKEIEQHDAAVNAARNKQDDVNAAAEKVNEKEKDLNREVNELKNAEARDPGNPNP
jgi:peptidoglycan hydrolase CwlO-like protein